jgi:putative effector of murein hydrolase LrgA (UPF0299 family)
VEKRNTIYMKARLILILIFFSTLTVVLTNGKSTLFASQSFIILNKTINLNSEMIISLIVLSTLISVLILGIIDKVFFSRKEKKDIEKSE